MRSASTRSDAREAHPTRSEYRLYYNLPLIAEKANAGDLLLLFRTPGSGDLSAVVARAGSQVEEKLLDAVFAGDEPSLDSFRLVTPPTLSRATAEDLVAAMTPARTAIDSYRAREHPVYTGALAGGDLPPGVRMAQAGQELAETRLGRELSSDDRLAFGLDAETELYFAITHELGERKLAALREAGAGFAAVAAYVMQVSQSARSRRGSSLQWHFAYVLERAGVPFTSQCATEGKEKPDFVIPGYNEYHDPRYPPDRLRMVACKSTVKERWRQILTEAARIDEKSLLTLDAELTDDTIAAMRAAKLKPFLPASVLDLEYSSRPAARA